MAMVKSDVNSMAVRAMASAAIMFRFPDARNDRILRRQMVFLFFTFTLYHPPSPRRKDSSILDPYGTIRKLGNLFIVCNHHNGLGVFLA
mgnify:FL=1